jgi:hypothetical protein
MRATPLPQYDPNDLETAVTRLAKLSQMMHEIAFEGWGRKGEHVKVRTSGTGGPKGDRFIAGQLAKLAQRVNRIVNGHLDKLDEIEEERFPELTENRGGYYQRIEAMPDPRDRCSNCGTHTDLAGRL